MPQTLSAAGGFRTSMAALGNQAVHHQPTWQIQVYDMGGRLRTCIPAIYFRLSYMVDIKFLSELVTVAKAFLTPWLYHPVLYLCCTDPSPPAEKRWALSPEGSVELHPQTKPAQQKICP